MGADVKQEIQRLSDPMPQTRSYERKESSKHAKLSRDLAKGRKPGKTRLPVELVEKRALVEKGIPFREDAVC